MTLQVSKTDPKAFCSYVDAGFTLFPCTGYSKIPARKGFLELPFDPEFVPDDHNYGVLLKQKFLVIDCDPRAYNDGDKPLTRLLGDLDLPLDLFKKTFTVRTPRGGYHIYFSKPEGVLIVNNLKAYPGLEFKTKFIMAAGSYIALNEKKEPVNKGYVPVFHAPSTIIPAPQILLAKLLAPKPITLDPNVKLTPDNPADIKAFTDHCLKVDPATEGELGDLRTFQVACAGREYGLNQATTLSLMIQYYNPRCNPIWDPADLRIKVENAYTYGTRSPAGVKSIQNAFPDDGTEKKTPQDKTETITIKYQPDAKGNIKKGMFNLRMFFSYPTIYTPKGEVKPLVLKIPPIGNYIKFDQFSHQILWDKPAPWYKSNEEWSDEDAIEFKSILAEQLGMDYSTDLIHEVATVCASKRAFHPVRNYLERCQWDGVKRLDNWLSRYCGALDNEYTRFVGRKVLVAAVARVFRPGCKFDHVLVTEGTQGLGKSYMWEILAGPWFTDAPLNIHDKSAVEVMQGKWVIELAEMDALSKYETQTIRGFLTRTSDRCRMAYDRKAKNFPRQNIFVGSINPEQTGWLKDHTGNRRFWPVAVSSIDLAGLKADKDNLWAEALLAFEKGEKLFVEDKEMRRMMAYEVESRMQEDPWFNLIEEHLHERTADYVKGDKVIVTPIEIFTQCVNGNASHFKHPEANRMATILKTLGFSKTRVSNKLGYAYVKDYVSEI